MPFPDTESPQEKSAGIPHRAAESQGGCLVKGDGVKYQGGRSWNTPGTLGTESHVTIHSRPAWEAKAELNAITDQSSKCSI